MKGDNMADQTSLLQIFEAVGGLKAEVVDLRRDFHDSDSRAEENIRRADAHRAVVHRRVDELVHEFGEVKGDIVQVKRDVAQTKLVTDEVTRWKLMGMGALGITGIAAASVGSLLTYYWAEIVRLFRAGG